MSETRRQHYLSAMGIETWRLRDDWLQTDQPPQSQVNARPVEMVVVPVTVSQQENVPPGWDELQAAVLSCQGCDLSKGRNRAVFGAGDRAASWMFIAEAPGTEEDQQGEPFVGQSGKLLDAMLSALGLTREQIYLTNVIKCRPPGNRDPDAHEMKCCAPFLQRQIELVQPKIIVLLGRIAAHAVLHTDRALGELRNQVYEYGEKNIPVVVTYHPAYLSRTPHDKHKAWLDLCRANKILSDLSV